MMNLNPAPPSRFQLLPIASTGSGSTTLSVGGKSAESGGRSPRTPREPVKTPTAVTGGKTLDVKKSAATTPTAGTARKRDRSPVAATAASFFGSMGSSWFGGSGGGGGSGNGGYGNS